MASNQSAPWSGRRDSNPQPSPWKGDALPIELLPHLDTDPWLQAGVLEKSLSAYAPPSGYPIPGGGTGRDRTCGLLSGLRLPDPVSDRHLHLSRTANCATAPCMPLMPPAVRRGGDPRRYFPRRINTLPGRDPAARGWNLVEGKHADQPYLDGERTRAGMLPGPVKHPEPQSCALLEEVTGVEPASPGWEPGILTDGRYLRVARPVPGGHRLPIASGGGLAGCSTHRHGATRGFYGGSDALCYVTATAWRSGGDSNPRRIGFQRPLSPGGFQDRCLRPLDYRSVLIYDKR